jgi:hypothetical protein
MRLVAVIEDPAVSEKILRHLGRWQRGPPRERRVGLDPAALAEPPAASVLLGQCVETPTQTPSECEPPHHRHRRSLRNLDFSDAVRSVVVLSLPRGRAVPFPYGLLLVGDSQGTGDYLSSPGPGVATILERADGGAWQQRVQWNGSPVDNLGTGGPWRWPPTSRWWGCAVNRCSQPP